MAKLCLAMAGGSGKGASYRNTLDDEIAPLTVREEEVLEYAAAGRANKDIADQLSTKVRTVEKHFEKIFEKLNVHSRGAAIYLLYERRLARKEAIINEQRREIERLRRRLARKDRPT